MKQIAKYLSLLAVVLLCVGGGVFLSRFTASSPECRQASHRFSPLLPIFPGPVSLRGAGPYPQQHHGPGRGRDVRHLGVLLSHLRCGAAGFHPGLCAGQEPGTGLCLPGSGRAGLRQVPGRDSRQDRHLPGAGFSLSLLSHDLLCILAGLTAISLRRFAIIALLTPALGPAVCQRFRRRLLLHACVGHGPDGVAGLALFLVGMKYGNRVENAVLRALDKESQGM